MKAEASSYRDPDGFVAYAGDDVYRCIVNDQSPILLPQYQEFFKKAVESRLLVPFEHNAENTAVLKLQKLSLITYPYEWGFEQLKEAALVTLDIGLLALDHGLSLKDATAFNVQQYKGRMIFIDHTSFEISAGSLPWRPYSQFCRHFIAPLLMTSKTGRNANKSFRLNLDGLDLAEACSSLPLRSRFRPGVFFHIYLHHYLINNFKNSNSDTKVKSSGTGNQKAYLQHLRHFVQKISPPRYDTEWHDYYANTNYDDSSFAEKEKIVRKIIGQKPRRCAWDIGANNGHFSRLISEHAGCVLSMDIDHAAIDLNFLKNRQLNKTNIFPLVMDLTNPSPALGFANSERTTIGHRSAPDIIVALALIHHLAITYNIPFPHIARYLHGFGAELLIEYVDRDDSQVKRLLRSKDHDYAAYNQHNFEESFLKLFSLVEKHNVPGTQRILYQFSPRPE